MEGLKRVWEAAGRDLAWGGLFYLLTLAILFFVFTQGTADFIYRSF